MKVKRFQTLLDARGPDLGLWPEADRLAAEALLDRSDVARAALTEAETLHLALQSLPDEAASPLLRAAILDIPDLHDPASDASAAGHSSRRGMVAGWSAIAASAAIGFAVGMWWPAEPPIWQSEDLVALVYGGSGFDEVLR